MAEVSDSIVGPLQDQAELLTRKAATGTESECRELMVGTALMILRAFPKTTQPGVIGGAGGGA